MSGNAYITYKPTYCSQSPNVTLKMAELVKASFNLVASGETPSFKNQHQYRDPSLHLAMVFYDRLFEVAPAVKPLFKKPQEQQGKMLISMISSAVGLLDDLPSLVPVLDRLARRHVAYGVKLEMYGLVGEVLIYALNAIAGDAFTGDMQTAWIEVFSLMLSVMLPGHVAQEEENANAAASANS